MKKYLKEIEIAGMLLIGIGLIIAHTAGYDYGAWPCGCGILLLLASYLYKAFHWKEYEAENRRNIWIIVICILIIFIQFLIIKT
jgi:amino acid permease